MKLDIYIAIKDIPQKLISSAKIKKTKIPMEESASSLPQNQSNETHGQVASIQMNDKETPGTHKV